MHLKDRKFNNGPNMPWGQGDTPIKQVLALMKSEGYRFPATIEQEYKIPDGSDAVKEVIKCREYAVAALA
jgi:sugar phosphate isomerase/epimerase